jgi:hypothetical protein
LLVHLHVKPVGHLVVLGIKGSYAPGGEVELIVIKIRGNEGGEKKSG